MSEFYALSRYHGDKSTRQMNNETLAVAVYTSHLRGGIQTAERNITEGSTGHKNTERQIERTYAAAIPHVAWAGVQFTAARRAVSRTLGSGTRGQRNGVHPDVVDDGTLGSAAADEGHDGRGDSNLRAWHRMESRSSESSMG